MRQFSHEFKAAWPVLVVATFGNMCAIYSLLFFGLSSFMEPLKVEYGWSRPQVGMVLTYMTLTVTVISPFVGRVCDRLGSRVVVLVSAPLAAVAMAALSRLGHSLWQLYAGYSLAILFGAGTLAIAYVGTVTVRFERHRGLALGIAFAGGGVAALMLPLLLTPAIFAWGWRRAFLGLALLPLLQWLLAYLLLPAGKPRSIAEESVVESALDGLTWAQCVRGTKFWVMASTFILLGLTLSGLIVHLIALLTDQGLSDRTAARSVALLGLGIIGARVFCGWLVDRLSSRYVASSVFAGAAVGCGLLVTGNVVAAAIGILLLGLTTGAEMDLLAFMTTRYFGLREQGAIFGSLLSLFTFGAVFSPPLVGGLYAVTGGYSTVLAVCGAACVLAALLVLTLGPYPKRFIA